jgi:hypothetical protein
VLESSLQLELFLKSKQITINYKKVTSKNIHIWGGSILYLSSSTILENLKVKKEQVKQKYNALFTAIDAIELAKKLKNSDEEEGLIFLMAGLHEVKKSIPGASFEINEFNFLLPKAFKSFFKKHDFNGIITKEKLKSTLSSLVEDYSTNGDIKTLFKIFHLQRQYKSLNASKIYSQIINTNKNVTNYFREFNFQNLAKNDKTVFNKYLGLISQDNFSLPLNRSFSALHRYIFQGTNKAIPQIFQDMDHLILKAIKYCKGHNCSKLYSQLKGTYPIYDIVSAALIYSNLNIESLSPIQVKDNTYISLIILTNMLSKRLPPQKNQIPQTKSIVRAWSNLDLDFNYELIYEIKNLSTYKKNFDYNIKILNSILKTKNYKLVLLQYPGHDFQFIENIAKQNNLSIILNDPEFLKAINKDGFFYYFNDNLVYKTGHLNSAGNKKWSKYIGNIINSFL